jgi:hypothetical protein
MQYAKKMVLVTPEEAARLKNTNVDQALPPAQIVDAAPIHQPQDNTLISLDAEMQRILALPIKSDFEKWTMYKQILQRYVNKLREIRSAEETALTVEGDFDPSEGADQHDDEREARRKSRDERDFSTYNALLAQSFPSEMLKNKARVLINLLKRNRDVEWDSTGRVLIEGVVNPSKFDELLRAAVKKTAVTPEGWNQFSRVLTRMNVPRGYFGHGSWTRREPTRKISNAKGKHFVLAKWKPY